MLEREYRREMDAVVLTAEQKEKLVDMMTGTARAPRAIRAGRTVLVAAAVCAVLAASALAYVAGALDFLKGREEYQFLGQAALYEDCAQRVDLSATADNGDTLTIEYTAMDENFCTVFYTLETAEPMEVWSQREHLPISPDAPDLWQAMGLEPSFTLEADGVVLTGGQDGQQYLLDANTLVGMSRLPLNRAGALENGKTVTLRAEAPLGDWDGVSDREEAGQWSFTLTAEPMEAQTYTLSTPAALGERQVESLSVTVSPLGTVLRARVTVPEEYRAEPDLWGGLGWFVVRDEDGRYYPYDALTSALSEDGTAWEESYILYGLEDAETLELLTAELDGEFVTVGLEDLPWQGEGGYTFASFTVEEGQMTLRLEPDGVVGSTGYCGSVAYFLRREAGADELPQGFREDESGRLFYGDGAPDIYQNSYTDWRDGSVTVTWSLDEAAQAQAEELTGLELYVETYVPQEGTGVLLALTK
ncbi:DUF4179 domain-containing protein [Pseudoflavonifractor sp.]|jgi:hypothetical protein|uniref:DUF4179 domain-containing protein n=1 Tax=Pseudoflavonifractor sp. TaxID=1980281 RepID=UPI003D94D7D8